jgi:hypothetical protein
MSGRVALGIRHSSLRALYPFTQLRCVFLRLGITSPSKPRSPLKCRVLKCRVLIGHGKIIDSNRFLFYRPIACMTMVSKVSFRIESWICHLD